MDSQSDASRFFDSFAEAFDTIYDGKRNVFVRWLDHHFRNDMFIRFALSFESLGDLTGKTVLDIGCGSGPYVLEALKRGASKVTALDPAPTMLSLARNRIEQNGYLEKCNFINGTFPGISLPIHDDVIVMGVMDYVEDARSFLAGLLPLVKTSAVISFPSYHWFRTPFRKVRYRLRHCPVYFYSESRIRELCTTVGFRTVTIQKIPGAGMDFHVCLKP